MKISAVNLKVSECRKRRVHPDKTTKVVTEVYNDSNIPLLMPTAVGGV